LELFTLVAVALAVAVLHILATMVLVALAVAVMAAPDQTTLFLERQILAVAAVALGVLVAVSAAQGTPAMGVLGW